MYVKRMDSMAVAGSTGAGLEEAGFTGGGGTPSSEISGQALGVRATKLVGGDSATSTLTSPSVLKTFMRAV